MRGAVAALLAVAAEGKLGQRVLAPSKPEPANHLVAKNNETMVITPHNLVEVKLGPFASAGEACDYCFGSFTKKGDAPAGPVAPYCVCMAYPDNGGYTMFCSTPQSSAGYVKDKGGCRCNQKDMAAMGETTCTPI